MSSPGSQKDKPELLAGHPPAVVAGGMRIVQHKKESGDAKQEMTAADEAEFGPATPPRPDTHHQQLLLSGAVCKGDRDFQAAAIKSHHEKPMPCHEVKHAQPSHVIHQPRK